MTTLADSIPVTVRITARDPALPILKCTGRQELAIRAGTAIEINGTSHAFAADTSVVVGDLTPGRDYAVTIGEDGTPKAVEVGDFNPLQAEFPAGFHFAPGGCAEARAGGDDIPAINPHSLWDLGFRPACPDPRGMACIETKGGRFWADIYLLGTGHEKDGTSRIGAEIADGGSLELLDYATASGIVAKHGKRLLTYSEFVAASFGVTERSSAKSDPKVTGLDAARTSRFGLMQATGNLWSWGTDGDPDDPRPSLFGGAWINGSAAGSRCADLDYLWPENSNGRIGCRAASDHL